MPTNKKQVKQRRYRDRALDPAEEPMRRLRAVRTLVEISEYSKRTCPVARRVANELLNPEQPTEVRDLAVKVLEIVAVGEAQRKNTIPEPLIDDEVQAVIDGEPIPVPMGIKMAERAKSAPAIVAPQSHVAETRQEELARKNRYWNAEPVPQKWLTFYEPADLTPYGITDPINDPRRLFVDIHLFNQDGSIFGKANPFHANRMLNPLYWDSYQEWKAKRFPHGLPARDSTWRIRYEDRSFINSSPTLLVKWPAEFPSGAELRSREYQRGEIEVWEEFYAHELYFEILLQNRGEFFVMFEIEGPDDAFYRFLNEPQKELSATEDGNVKPPKLVCRICVNASAILPAPHDCSEFMVLEITPSRNWRDHVSI